ncbi:hypothetical protein PVAG01_01343 [Phlyctema vagabunda]|uniref:Uncharacterized protein n=1 Tax=Phlyctema vagabunda TaxID=108571 RepID=A0ABR4PWU2_9HELO
MSPNQQDRHESVPKEEPRVEHIQQEIMKKLPSVLKPLVESSSTMNYSEAAAFITKELLPTGSQIAPDRPVSVVVWAPDGSVLSVNEDLVLHDGMSLENLFDDLRKILDGLRLNRRLLIRAIEIRMGMHDMTEGFPRLESVLIGGGEEPILEAEETQWDLTEGTSSVEKYWDACRQLMQYGGSNALSKPILKVRTVCMKIKFRALTEEDYRRVDMYLAQQASTLAAQRIYMHKHHGVPLSDLDDATSKDESSLKTILNERAQSPFQSGVLSATSSASTSSPTSTCQLTEQVVTAKGTGEENVAKSTKGRPDPPKGAPTAPRAMREWILTGRKDNTAKHVNYSTRFELGEERRLNESKLHKFLASAAEDAKKNVVEGPKQVDGGLRYYGGVGRVGRVLHSPLGANSTWGDEVTQRPEQPVPKVSSQRVRGRLAQPVGKTFDQILKVNEPRAIAISNVQVPSELNSQAKSASQSLQPPFKSFDEIFDPEEHQSTSDSNSHAQATLQQHPNSSSHQPSVPIPSIYETKEPHDLPKNRAQGPYTLNQRLQPNPGPRPLLRSSLHPPPGQLNRKISPGAAIRKLHGIRENGIKHALLDIHQQYEAAREDIKIPRPIDNHLDTPFEKYKAQHNYSMSSKPAQDRGARGPAMKSKQQPSKDAGQQQHHGRSQETQQAPFHPWYSTSVDAPRDTNFPFAQYPHQAEHPAQQYQADYPAQQYPAVNPEQQQYPAVKPALQYPAVNPEQQYLAQQYRAQTYQTQKHSAQSYPAYQYSEPQYPEPQSSAHQYPSYQYPAPQYSEPSYSTQQYAEQKQPEQQHTAQNYLANQYQAHQYSEQQQHSAPPYPTQQYPDQHYPAQNYPVQHSGYQYPVQQQSQYHHAGSSTSGGVSEQQNFDPSLFGLPPKPTSTPAASSVQSAFGPSYQPGRVGTASPAHPVGNPVVDAAAQEALRLREQQEAMREAEWRAKAAEDFERAISFEDDDIFFPGGE